jgi:hypothetical protein
VRWHEQKKTTKAEFGVTAMEKEAGAMVSIQSDAVETMEQNGKYGRGQAQDTTNTKHSVRQWSRASNCVSCSHLLEEWEYLFCEGCGLALNLLGE